MIICSNLIHYPLSVSLAQHNSRRRLNTLVSRQHLVVAPDLEVLVLHGEVDMVGMNDSFG